MTYQRDTQLEAQLIERMKAEQETDTEFKVSEEKAKKNSPHLNLAPEDNVSFNLPFSVERDIEIWSQQNRIRNAVIASQEVEIPIAEAKRNLSEEFQEYLRLITSVINSLNSKNSELDTLPRKRALAVSNHYFSAENIRQMGFDDQIREILEYVLHYCKEGERLATSALSLMKNQNFLE